MACYSPITGWRGQGGKITFNRKDAYVDLPEQTVTCGQCIGCRIDRSQQWAMRCLHESQLYSDNCFITLTFDEENCPTNMSLDVPTLQKFFKRLRKKYAKDGKKIRFYACGEYGDKYLRPHYHACIFNHDFEDKQLWTTRNGNRLYVSQALMQLWPYGHSLIGDVTFESAAYVARYVMKKITGQQAEEAYFRADENGECWRVKPEFNTMSRKPGIGSDWYDQYKGDVYPKDSLHVQGRKVKPPKFYDNRYQIDDEEAFKKLKIKRQEMLKKIAEDNTPARLAVKEAVTKAKLGLYKRETE